MNKRKQNGAVLFMSLIFLLVMTILGVSSMNDTIMQDKMVGAMQDSNIALQGVETAVRSAESFIDGIAAVGDFGVTPGLYVEADAATPSADPYDKSTWTNAGSIEADSVTGLAERPRYYIELSGEVTSDDTALALNQDSYSHESGAGIILGFRIVARSTGSTGTSQRLVESYYGKRF